MPYDPCEPCDPCNTAASARGQETFRLGVLIALCRIAEASAAAQMLDNFSMNLAQVAGTYDLFTADGIVTIDSIEFYNDVAGAGLTSVAAQTNDGTPETLLAAVPVASLTGGVNLTPYTGPLVLGDGKKGQYTIVGNGTAGTIIALVRYHGPGRLV